MFYKRIVACQAYKRLQYLSPHSGPLRQCHGTEALNTQTELPDDNRDLEPPDPMPNSEVKQIIANGSVALRHVRVGHRQASNNKPLAEHCKGFFMPNVKWPLFNS